MEFPESFFQGEYREGFYIPPLMKRTWAAEMEVFLRFREICEEHGLRFYAGYGTLLGTVRHGGFIPWDDDMDIWMLREDADRLNGLPEEVFREKGLILANSYHDERITNLAWRVDNGNTLMLSEDHMLAYHLCPFMVGLDVFPLDVVPRDKEKERTQERLLAMANTLCHQWDDPRMTAKEKNTSCQRLERVTGIRPDPSLPAKQRLMIMCDRILSAYGPSEGDLVAFIPKKQKMRNEVFRPEWFGEPAELPFEQILMPVPQNAEAVLRAQYGADYMTPKQSGGDHSYPFYGKQYEKLKRLFEDEGMELPPFLAK